MQDYSENKNYWDNFYASTRASELKPPSQFAAFVIGEIPKEQVLIVDIGCGTGRDTLFFSSQGIPVVGIDGSKSAINHCEQVANSLRLPAMFIHRNVHDADLCQQVQALPEYQLAQTVVIYARFFIHAITEEDENFLFALVKNVGPQLKTLFAAEFRTHRDATMPKETAIHYRRFIDPHEFLVRSINLGLNVEYYVEGFGLAKYKSDDAHVARYLLSI